MLLDKLYENIRTLIIVSCLNRAEKLNLLVGVEYLPGKREEFKMTTLFLFIIYYVLFIMSLFLHLRIASIYVTVGKVSFWP